MENKKRYSLRYKVIAVNLVLILAVAVCLVLLLTKLGVSRFTEMKRETVKSVIEGQVREIRFALSRPQGAVVDLAKKDEIVKYFDNNARVQDTQILEIFKSFSLGREYANVYLIDTTGKVVVSVDPSFIDNNFSYRDYFKYALEGKPHMQIAFGVLTKKPGYYFSAPVVKDDAVIGVVVIKLDTSYIENTLQDSPTQSIGHYMLTDENGVIILSDKEIEPYQSLGLIREEKKQKLALERRFDGFGMKPMQYQVAQDIVDNYKDPVSLDYMDNEDKENELLQIYRVGEYPFYLVTESDLDSIAGQISQIVWPIILLMLGGIVAGEVMQYFIFQKMFRPLAKLEQYSLDVVGGKVDSTFNIQSGDEIQSLAESVSKMVATLADDRQGLEQRVKEKTEELSNKMAELFERNKESAASEAAMLNILEDSRELEKQLAEEKKGVEQKVVERTKQLREEEAKLMASISALPQAIILVDLESKILTQNSRLEAIFGVNQKEWSLATIDERLGNSFELRAKLKQVLSERKIFDIDEFGYGTKYLQVYMAPVFGDEQELIGAVITINDVTEERVLSRSKDEFFSIASHELRTPLTAIRGNAEMIMDHYGETIKIPDVIEMLKDIHTGSVRLVEIVNDFLNVSRLEMGKIEFKLADLDMSELVQGVIKDFQATGSSQKLELKLEQVEGNIPKVLADGDRVKQVLINLIGNGFKFTERGGVSIKIEHQNDQVVVHVSDTGAGIAPEQQNLLFHKFQQAGSSLYTRDTSRGTGLGLYISRLIVEGMGGKIWLEKSETGKGSTFAFALPVSQNTLKGV